LKKLYISLLTVFLLLLFGFGLLSLVDTDATVSQVENRKLASKPKFTFSSVFDGSYVSQMESYYTDTFPLREQLLKVNKAMNHFYYYSGSGNDNLLIINSATGAENGGESLTTAQKASGSSTVTSSSAASGSQAGSASQSAQTPSASAAASEASTSSASSAAAASVSSAAGSAASSAQEPPLDNPDESQAQQAGNVIVVGTRAMEIPTANNDIIARYAQAVNNLAAAMGSGVRTISLVTPNGGEFYSPESMHTGVHSQKAMIDLCYSDENKDIVKVDAYSALREHVNDYIYFRTDHHWTALGAYYAYTMFCKAAGFEAVPLDKFEKGSYQNFVGSMYTFTSGYPQSETLKENPDTLDYYLPIVETHAKYYADSSLTNGVPVSVVYTKLSDSVSNKYLCFIGGDTPICIIDTAASGPVCMVLKESYGNAFVPFLTSHYSKIVVIDPREFNRDGKPSLDLTKFAKEQGINDLIVINYPYMINSTGYIHWLNRLVGLDQ
jgi:hypothetical protein